MSEKSELRYKYKIKRKYFQHSQREVADGAICDAVLAALGNYDGFFVYYSLGAEADTRTIIDKLIALDKRVYLPRVTGSEIIPVRYFGDETALTKNKFGVLEPSGGEAKEKIDVCIAPLLAINHSGYRLGYGGGYYDRFFASHGGVLKVGIGYSLQITEDLTPDSWDEPLDKFICERGIIDFGE